MSAAVKTILLFRHGKSDWHADYGEDHDRPLNKRGVRAAKLMGRHLAQLGQLPDLVLSSSAVRARDTVRLAAEAGSWSCRIETTPELYTASPNEVLELVRQCPDDIDTVLLAGHEPTWSELTGELIGGAAVKFPTAAIARIGFATERWSEIGFGRGALVWLVTPKLLAGTAGAEGS